MKTFRVHFAHEGENSSVDIDAKTPTGAREKTFALAAKKGMKIFVKKIKLLRGE